MLWMMVTTGVRRNEMWMLKKDDLDWDNSVIRVGYGKGQKERQIPFERHCQRAMLRYIQQRRNSLDWLWVTEEGIRLGYDGIWQDMKRLAERAEVELKDACHIFRRTFAANAVKQNIPRPYVQTIAGWSTPQMLDHCVAAMEAEEETIEAFREFKPFGKQELRQGQPGYDKMRFGPQNRRKYPGISPLLVWTRIWRYDIR